LYHVLVFVFVFDGPPKQRGRTAYQCKRAVLNPESVEDVVYSIGCLSPFAKVNARHRIICALIGWFVFASASEKKRGMTRN
jgi:hypothetical protein